MGADVSVGLSDTETYLDMAETIEAEPKKIDAGVAFRLWIGMLLPPAAWVVQLQTLWLTSEYGCKTSDFFWNHVVSIIALAVSIVGGLVAVREWRSAGAGTNDDDATRKSRRLFMAMIGIMTGSLFTIVIFALWLPTLMGVPCEK